MIKYGRSKKKCKKRVGASGGCASAGEEGCGDRHAAADTGRKDGSLHDKGHEREQRALVNMQTERGGRPRRVHADSV